METLKVTESQKKILEDISRIYECSLEEALDKVLNNLDEDLSDRKLVNEIIEYKKENPKMKHYTYDEVIKNVYDEE